jgi:hypothetical protein
LDNKKGSSKRNVFNRLVGACVIPPPTFFPAVSCWVGRAAVCGRCSSLVMGVAGGTLDPLVASMLPAVARAGLAVVGLAAATPDLVAVATC